MNYNLVIPLVIILGGAAVAALIIGPSFMTSFITTDRSESVQTAATETTAVRNVPEHARKATLAIDGMYCVGCRRSVVSSLEAMDGVVKASADPQRDTGWAIYNPATITPEKMVTAPIFDTYPAKVTEVTDYEPS